MDLIYDVKYLIASLNHEAWYWMYRIDDEFKNYATSKQGIKEYKKIHTQLIINKNYTEYKLFEKLHREDGPAYISEYSQQWWINGERHREDGPAIIYNELQEWYINGKLHREDGPAVIYKNVEKWYINGIKHRENRKLIDIVRL